MSKTTSDSTAYMRIYNYIADEIVNGNFSVGEAIPTQVELSEKFHVSRVTVREAIKELIRRNILQSTKGKGTYVLAKPISINLAKRTGEISAEGKSVMGRVVRSKVIKIELVPADRELCASLRVPLNTLLVHIYRLRIVADLPACLDDVYLVKRYTKEIDFFHEDLESNSLYRLLHDKAGLCIDRVEERFRALCCSDEVAQYLDINPGDPVLQERRLTYDDRGRLIEYCTNYQRSDVYYNSVVSRYRKESDTDPLQYQKTLGCLLGAASGDALGSHTRGLRRSEIKTRFGGMVKIGGVIRKNGIEVPNFGSVSGYFSQVYFVALEMSKSAGVITPAMVQSVLCNWADYPEYFALAGQTTKLAVRRLLGEDIPDDSTKLTFCNQLATVDGAIRAIPAGLISIGDIDRAVQNATEICLATHPYDTTLSAACAVAGAISTAMMPESTLEAVLEAGLLGAKKGFTIGQTAGVKLAVASVEKRMRLAIELALRKSTSEDKQQSLSDIIGTGIQANEAVPCAFGILAANPGASCDAINMAISIGGETSAIATIVGAIAGALYGVDALPKGLSKTIKAANGFDIEWLVRDIVRTHSGSFTDKTYMEEDDEPNKR